MTEQDECLPQAIRALLLETDGEWEGPIERLADCLELGVVKSKTAMTKRLKKSRNGLAEIGITTKIAGDRVFLKKQKSWGVVKESRWFSLLTSGKIGLYDFWLLTGNYRVLGRKRSILILRGEINTSPATLSSRPYSDTKNPKTFDKTEPQKRCACSNIIKLQKSKKMENTE